jgi:hypothetical protein
MPWSADVGLRSISSRLAIAGLVGLVALDVVLVGMALRSTHTSGIDTNPVSTTIVSAGVLGSPPLTPPVTPAIAPLQTMLRAVDNQRAWRLGAGSCSAGGATVARTADGGRTWVQDKTHLRRIVRVRPLLGQTAFVIGTGASCRAELRTTSDGGATWASADYLGTLWFRDPRDQSVVWAPGPFISKPCGRGAVLDLAVDLSTDSARVLCADGLVRSSPDTASSWTDVARVTGAVALAVQPADQAQTFVARVDVPGCAGVQILRVGQRVATSCVRTAVPIDPGHIALSLVNGGGWLTAGNTTMRSTDDLLTWRVS